MKRFESVDLLRHVLDLCEYRKERRGTGQTSKISRIMPAHSCRTMHRYLTRPHPPASLIIQADSLEQAVEIAEGWPGLEYAQTVEVRAIDSEAEEL